MILIVNYGLGNIGSIYNMLKRIGIESQISNNPLELKQATKIILPGVGSFDAGMTNLKKLGWIEPLNERIFIDKTPILGICLGMQLMTLQSEEGDLPGLGWINAETIRFKLHSKLKVPHMGWNEVNNTKSDLFLGIENPRFYFVHSYHVRCNRVMDIAAFASYEIDFVASFKYENIYGVQFHPEKSHKFGMKLLENFAKEC